MSDFRTFEKGCWRKKSKKKQDKQAWKWFMERVGHSALTWNKAQIVY